MLSLLAPAHETGFEGYARILIEIGPLVIYRYAFMILLGILGALILGLREGKKLGITTDDIIDGLIIILPIAILGTRVYYVIFDGSWSQFFNIRSGGLAIHGGFIAAVIASYFYTKYKKLDIFRVYDLIAPGFLIGQAFGRWGNFFNREAHGGVVGGMTNGNAVLSHDQQFSFLTDTLKIPEFIANNMFIGGNYVHPTFLYESLWNFLGLGVILILRRTKFIRSGDLIAVYLIWYSVARFFIESMRTDALFIGDTGLRIAQVISILMVLAGVLILVLNRVVFKRKHYAKILEENVVQ